MDISPPHHIYRPIDRAACKDVGPSVRCLDFYHKRIKLSLVPRKLTSGCRERECSLEAFNLFNRPNFVPWISDNRVIYTAADAMTGVAVIPIYRATDVNCQQLASATIRVEVPLVVMRR